MKKNEKISIWKEAVVKFIVEKSVTGAFVVGFGAVSALATAWYHMDEAKIKQKENNINIPMAIEQAALESYRAGWHDCVIKREKKTGGE